MKEHFLFVYGTLRKGYGNSYLLANSELIGAAKTTNKYQMLIEGSIPFVRFDVHNVEITGEVYKVSNETLEEIDILEGHPTWYIRKTVPIVLLDSCREIEAWLYFNDTVDETKLKEIETGDYKDYNKKLLY
jgi:gamma-glutamylaminecyclotransferase